MGTVSDLLGLAGAKLTPDASPALAPEQRSADLPANRDKMTFADLGTRIGEDNEALRNLLIDTSHQLSTIDDLKETFGKLVDPLANLLTTLEQERATNEPHGEVEILVPREQRGTARGLGEQVALVGEVQLQIPFG